MDADEVLNEYGLHIEQVDREFMEQFPKVNFDAKHFQFLVEQNREFQNHLKIVPVTSTVAKKTSEAWNKFGSLVYNGRPVPIDRHHCIPCWEEKRRLVS